MIVSYAVSDSEDEDNSSDCEPQSSASAKVPIKEDTASAVQKNTSKFLPTQNVKQTKAESTVVNGDTSDSHKKIVTEDESGNVPITFSAQIEDMLSGLPPPKKKKVTASESFLSNSSISASLTSLTKKNVPGKTELSKQGSNEVGQQLTGSTSAKAVDSDDDSDSEPSVTGNSVSSEKTANGVADSVESSTSGLRFENALLKMLPKARTTVDLKKAAQLLVPDSVKNKQKTVPQKSSQSSQKPSSKVSSLIEDDDEMEDNTPSVSYFNFMDSAESAPSTDISTRDYYMPQTSSQSESCEFGEGVSNEQYYQYVPTLTDNTYNHTSDQMTALSSLNTADDLDPQVLQRLQGRRKDEFIEIKDVSAEDQLQDVSIEITKGLSEEQDQPCDDLSEMSKKDKNDPSQRRAKSKHQINWLVSQAKSREVALKNQWASNRMNRKATQMKYGF